MDDKLVALSRHVFSTEDIVEVVLKFVVGGKSVKEILQLRLVCKLWRKVAFGLLLNRKHSEHPVSIHSADVLTKFCNQIFPDSYIPIAVQVSEAERTAEQLNFLNLYSEVITCLEITNLSQFGEFGYHLGSQRIELPRLRKFAITLPVGVLSFHEDHPSYNMIKGIVLSTNKLAHFEVVVNFQGRALNSDDQFNLPAKPTSLKFIDCIWNQRFFDTISRANLSQVKKLWITIAENEEEPSDYSLISELLKRCSSTLDALTFQYKHDSESVDTNLQKIIRLENELPHLQNLSLSSVGCVSGVDDTPVSTYIPNLTRLKTEGPFAWHIVMALSSNNARFLKAKTFEVTHLNALTHMINEAHLSTSRLTTDFYSGLFESFPSIQNLTLSLPSKPSNVHVMTGVYRELECLEVLNFHITGGPAVFPQDECRCFNHIFLAWGGRNTVAKLKNLKELEFSVKDNVYLSDPAFAKFLRIPSLKSLRIGGNVMVDDSSKDMWTRSDREIEFQIQQDSA